jgi:transcriptional regulator with XRE-family HTH domain
MIHVMPAKVPSPYPTSERQLRALGERLRMARLRRGFAAETVCARANISRPTLSKVEHGDPSVTMGSYVQVLRVLGMDQDLATVAADDVVGRRLQDAGLQQRRRAPRRQSKRDEAGKAPTLALAAAKPSSGNEERESLSNRDTEDSPH